MHIKIKIHVDLLLGNDCGEISNYATAVTRQQPIKNRGMVFSAVCTDGWACNNGIRCAIAKQQLHCNRGPVFSKWSLLICYTQDQSVNESRERGMSTVGSCYQAMAVKT
jgi:hypothetical protein